MRRQKELTGGKAARSEQRFLGQITANSVLNFLGGVAGQFGWLKEMIINSYPDHQAERIQIVINADEGWVLVRDNGLGMSPAGWENYQGVGLHHEQMGSSFHGAGGRAFLKIAKRAELITRNREWGDQKARRLLVDRGEFINGRFAEPVVLREAPEGFPAHGLEIRISGFDDRKFLPTIEALRAWNELPPYVADRVTLHEENLDAPAIRLPKPVVTNQSLVELVKEPGIGEVNVYLYFPVSPKKTESFRIGSFGRYVSWRTFASQLLETYPLFARQIPLCYWDDRLCGVLDIAAFNPYRQPVGSEFDQSLFQDESKMWALVSFLRRYAEAKINPTLGIVEEGMIDSGTQAAIAEVTQDLRARLGDVRLVVPGKKDPPDPPVKVPVFSIVPRYTEQLVKEWLVISIPNVQSEKCSGLFDWKVESGHQCQVLDRDGREAKVRRMSAGDLHVTISDRHDPSVSRTVRYKFVTSRSRIFVPGETKITRGDVRIFTLVNVPAGLDFHFEIDEVGGRIVKTGRENGKPIVQVKGLKIGDGYELEAYEKGKADNPIKARFDVVPPDIEEETLGIDPNVFPFRDKVFTISVAGMGGVNPPTYVVTPPAGPGGAHTISVNRDHPAYLERAKGARPRMSDYILLCVSQAVSRTVVLAPGSEESISVMQAVLYGKRP